MSLLANLVSGVGLGLGLAIANADAHSSIQKIVLVGDNIKATVSVDGEERLSRRLKVELDHGEKSTAWEFVGFSLDPEKQGNIPADIIDYGKNTFLIVHAYSGGASCCWSLLVFDIGNLKSLGPLVSSKSPIRVQSRHVDCSLAVESESVAGETDVRRRKKISCLDENLLKDQLGKDGLSVPSSR